MVDLVVAVEVVEDCFSICRKVVRVPIDGLRLDLGDRVRVVQL